MKLPWIVDPKQKEESVSLTLLMVFALAALVLNILKSTGTVTEVASINELFYSGLALYFSRRNINIGGKNYSAVEAEAIKAKVS